MHEKSFARGEAFFIYLALRDRFPTAAVFEPAASAVAVVLSLFTCRVDRRFEPVDDEALVIVLGLVADLRELSVRSLEVTGGASDIEIFLPQPAGIVPGSSMIRPQTCRSCSWVSRYRKLASRPESRSMCTS